MYTMSLCNLSELLQLIKRKMLDSHIHNYLSNRLDNDNDNENDFYFQQ